MNIRKLFGEILFWLHVPVIIVWFGLFFIPASIWPSKVVYHFWFIILAFASQLLWGLILYPIRKHLGWGVCFLTTLNQRVRGYPISDPHNHNHWFLEELSERLGYKFSQAVIQSALVGSTILVTIQYSLVN